jgi:membrane protease YdiL (CAAX protease family)
MTLNRQLRDYFILAYVVCCILWIPLFLNALNVISSESSATFFILGAFGPMISAFIITFKVSGLSGCIKLFQKFFLIKVHYKWYILAFFIPIVIVLCVLVFLNIASNPDIDINFMNPLEFISGFLISLLIVTGEEFGWRGFALPRLQKKYNALTSSLILGILWSIIHFPLFFVQPERASGVHILIVVPGFVLLMVCFTIIITFLYNGSKGSIFISCVFHASLGISNHLYKSPNHDYDILAMYLFIVVTFIFSLFITLKFGYENLGYEKRSMDY